MKNAAQALILALVLATLPAFAQTQRTFPERTRLGTLEIRIFPRALLEGREITMAPGARIMDATNTIVTPASLRGPQPVRYRLDLLGQVSEAWILTPDEVRAAREAAAREGSRR